jgi:hypothetical protein
MILPTDDRIDWIKVSEILHYVLNAIGGKGLISQLNSIIHTYFPCAIEFMLL